MSQRAIVQSGAPEVSAERIRSSFPAVKPSVEPLIGTRPIKAFDETRQIPMPPSFRGAAIHCESIENTGELARPRIGSVCGGGSLGHSRIVPSREADTT